MKNRGGRVSVRGCVFLSFFLFFFLAILLVIEACGGGRLVLFIFNKIVFGLVFVIYDWEIGS